MYSLHLKAKHVYVTNTFDFEFESIGGRLVFNSLPRKSVCKGTAGH
jgi:hypothetical protein